MSKIADKRKPKIGQVRYCPQLGGIVILGVLSRKYYQTDLLVTDHFNDRYWISSNDLTDWPANYKSPTTADRFRRLTSVRQAN